MHPRTRATIAALAETILPVIETEGGERITPADLRIPERFAELTERLHPSIRCQLLGFVRMLGTSGGGLLLHGRPRPFVDLTPGDRDKALNHMAERSLVGVRNGAKSLKVLMAMLWVAADRQADVLPVWKAIGYPGPDGPAPDAARPIITTPVGGDEQWTADVVVVGSGAGGGVAAGVLGQAGLDVVVLEKGGYHAAGDYQHSETSAYRNLYLDGLLGTTVDGGLAVMAGATLGGGTVVNWTTSFPTPARLREEWDRVSGLPGVFTGSDYESASWAVSERLGLTTEFSEPSRRDVLMEEGLRRLGWQVGIQPRNVAGCQPQACGYCSMGCRIGAKQSTLVTYLQDAHAAGARLTVDADVRRVLVAGGRAVGVDARVGGGRLEVRARAVVLAAGALNTPAILLRSRVGGPAVGQFLHLHPVTGIWGRFPEPVDPWTGMLQTRYSDQFADLDGKGYGFVMETGPIHPVLPAAYLGWENRRRFLEDLEGYRHLSPIGILLRDRTQGKVTIRRDGSPKWRYRMAGRDLDHVREGVRRGAEVLAAAGAEEVIASTIRPVRWRPGKGTVDGFIAAVDSVGYGANQMSYASLHQMGGARMGADPGASVVGPVNEVHGTRGLYVMDGSCFPTASGINPMISIATIAHRAASALAAELT